MPYLKEIIKNLHETRSNNQMTPNEYQQLAARTRAPQDGVIGRIKGLGPEEMGIQLLHSIIGLTGEVGELAGAYEKFAYYGQTLDEANLKEELGDCLWYIAEACDALGISLQEVMKANIRKLKHRYPERYDSERAREENRNREAEIQQVVETKVVVAQMIPDPRSLELLLGQGCVEIPEKEVTDSMYDYLQRRAEEDYNRNSRKRKAEDDGVDYDA